MHSGNEYLLNTKSGPGFGLGEKKTMDKASGLLGTHSGRESLSINKETTTFGLSHQLSQTPAAHQLGGAGPRFGFQKFDL